MAVNMGKWHSKRGPNTKIMLSGGGKGDPAPVALGLWYDFQEFGCHLGNVGLATCPIFWDHLIHPKKLQEKLQGLEYSL